MWPPWLNPIPLLWLVVWVSAPSCLSAVLGMCCCFSSISFYPTRQVTGSGTSMVKVITVIIMIGLNVLFLIAGPAGVRATSRKTSALPFISSMHHTVLETKYSNKPCCSGRLIWVVSFLVHFQSWLKPLCGPKQYLIRVSPPQQCCPFLPHNFFSWILILK